MLIHNYDNVFACQQEGLFFSKASIKKRIHKCIIQINSVSYPYSIFTDSDHDVFPIRIMFQAKTNCFGKLVLQPKNLFYLIKQGML